MLPDLMVQSFLDEMTKIAVAGEQPPMASPGPSQLVTTTTTDPLNSWDKDTNWKKESPLNYPKPKLRRSTPDESAPSRLANKLFGRPLKNPPSGLQRTDDPSSAKQMTRDGVPIDAQSTANIAAANTIFPASGPGGV
jgi:hypothetical protein